MKKILLLSLIITTSALCMDSPPVNAMFSMDSVPLNELSTEDYLQLLTKTHAVFVDYYNDYSQQIENHELHDDHKHFIYQALYEHHILRVLHLVLERYNPELNQAIVEQKELLNLLSSPLPKNFEIFNELDQKIDDYEKRIISMKTLIKFYRQHNKNESTDYLRNYIASRFFFDRFPKFNEVKSFHKFHHYQELACGDKQKEYFSIEGPDGEKEDYLKLIEKKLGVEFLKPEITKSNRACLESCLYTSANYLLPEVFKRAELGSYQDLSSNFPNFKDFYNITQKEPINESLQKFLDDHLLNINNEISNFEDTIDLTTLIRQILDTKENFTREVETINSTSSQTKKQIIQWGNKQLGLAMLDIANGTFYENFVSPLHEIPRVTS